MPPPNASPPKLELPNAWHAATEGELQAWMCAGDSARLAATAELAATAKLGVAAKLAAGAIVKAASVHGFAGAVSLGVGAESAKAGGKQPTNSVPADLN